MFEKAKKKYAICIICILLTDFQEPLSVYHFEPYNYFFNEWVAGTKKFLKIIISVIKKWSLQSDLSYLK
jgi:hypothetical protein